VAAVSPGLSSSDSRQPESQAESPQHKKGTRPADSEDAESPQLTRDVIPSSARFDAMIATNSNSGSDSPRFEPSSPTSSIRSDETVSTYIPSPEELLAEYLGALAPRRPLDVGPVRVHPNFPFFMSNFKFMERLNSPRGVTVEESMEQLGKLTCGCIVQLRYVHIHLCGAVRSKSPPTPPQAAALDSNI
jgi:hypothetical protein